MVKPNFSRLLKVLWGEEPDRVPFYEHLVDNEVIETILNEPVPALLEPGVARLTESSNVNQIKENFVGNPRKVLQRTRIRLCSDRTPAEPSPNKHKRRQGSSRPLQGHKNVGR